MTNRIAHHKSQSPLPSSSLSYLIFLLPLVLLLVSPEPSSGSLPASDAAGSGKVLFEKRCTGCHSLDGDREGPRLRNVYGAKAGSTPTFKYSSALKSSNITWTDETLNKWLADPDSLVPDNDMEFHVPKPDERADIIRFLKAASGK
jgi:cytochrome c